MNAFLIAFAAGVAAAVLLHAARRTPVKAALSAACLACYYLASRHLGQAALDRYFHPSSWWAAFSVCAGAFVFSMIVAWKPFSFRTRAAVASASAVIASAVSVGFFLSAYSDAADVSPEPGPVPAEEVSLTEYEPFAAQSLVKTLDGPCTLKLDGELPRLDGATALFPVYSAFIRAAYPEGPGYSYSSSPYPETSQGMPRNTEYVAFCSSTSDAFRNLLDGKADVVFLMGVSGQQMEEAAMRGIELTLTPIGKEAFVFLVNSRNPVTGLTSGQVRGIYSGEITNWMSVGGSFDAILAYQRAKGSGSQTMLEKIMEGTPIMEAPTENVLGEMREMSRALADYRNYRNSIGFSFLFYMTGMTRTDEIRLLSIDGAEPGTANIQSGAYPFSDEFYAVTARREGAYINQDRTENIDALLGWILSEQGQGLVRATGYVPVK